MSQDQESDLISRQFNILGRYDHYIGSTNFKIGLLSSFIAAVLIGMLSKVIGPVDNASMLEVSVLLVSALCAIAALLSLSFLIRAASPVLSSNVDRSLVFFENVAAWPGGSEGYYKSFLAADDSEFLRDLTCQTVSVARVTQEKFRLIGRGFKVFVRIVLPLLGLDIILLTASQLCYA